MQTENRKIGAFVRLGGTRPSYKWKDGLRLEKGGHRIFRENRGEFAAPETCRWAIADNSGTYPDGTDDGVLWLDFTRPLQVEIGEYGIVDIPVVSDRSPDHSYWTGAGIDALVVLRAKFPAWEVRIGEKARKLCAALAGVTL